jgi:hypothetical protein
MTGFLAEDPENEYGDFFVVAGVFFSAGVTRETAERIERVLSRWIVPRWSSRARIIGCQAKAGLDRRAPAD